MQTKLSSPGSCGTFEPNLPLVENFFLSRQVTALGSAQFPGYTSMGYTDLQRRFGINGDRTRDLAVSLHKSIRAHRSATTPLSWRSAQMPLRYPLPLRYLRR